MPDAKLTQEVVEAAKRLITQSPNGDVDGEDIAAAIGHGTTNEVRNAFREAERLGELHVVHWRGGMGLPSIVRLP